MTAQEITQGWAAEINRKKPGRSQIYAYRQFHDAVDDFAEITILPFDEDAAEAYHGMQGLKLRGGTMDKKIAGIAISKFVTMRGTAPTRRTW